MQSSESNVAVLSHLNVPSFGQTPNTSRREHPEDSSNCDMETREKQTRNNKPLRPLISFMDEFFENIRNVKAIEGAKVGTKARAKQRNTNRSRVFLKGKSPDLIGNIRQQMPTFQRSPSPDILAALQSQSYQVLLTLENN